MVLVNDNHVFPQKERFLSAGWESVNALDMMTVYSMLPQEDVARYTSQHSSTVVIKRIFITLQPVPGKSEIRISTMTFFVLQSQN